MMLYDTVRREVIIGTVDSVYFLSLVYFLRPHTEVGLQPRSEDIETNNARPREVSGNANLATLAYWVT